MQPVAQAPWLQPWAACSERVQAAWQACGSLPEALNAQPAAPVRFVAQQGLPDGMAYEQFILEQGACPTRENLHDFYNGLCWLQFPASKRRLNQLQGRALQDAGATAPRGPLRDAITVFDENGALLSAPPALWQALRDGDWQALFVQHRALWQQAQLLLFGHALLEKLAQPRKPITAHVLDWPLPPAGCDAALAAALQPQWLATKPFLPLPVLGVPGWWPANEEPAFYEDAAVFRPRRG